MNAPPVPYQQRVKLERDELAQKICKLTSFITCAEVDTYKSLDPFEQSDLRSQLDTMWTYLDTLDRRIERFEDALKQDHLAND